MSLQNILNEMLQEVERQTMCDQHFGPGNSAHQLSLPSRAGYQRPYHNSVPTGSGTSNLVNDKDGFKVSLDVQQFKPEELVVKVVNDYVVIEGKHEERSDEHGFVSRQFKRRYRLPKDIDTSALKSTLSSDGVLQLHGPKLATEDANERSIPITRTNRPALK